MCTTCLPHEITLLLQNKTGPKTKDLIFFFFLKEDTLQISRERGTSQTEKKEVKTFSRVTLTF